MEDYCELICCKNTQFCYINQAQWAHRVSFSTRKSSYSEEEQPPKYEKAIKLIKESEKLLEAGEGKVLKVLEKNGKLETEELD